jgi:hypothetical protein
VFWLDKMLEHLSFKDRELIKAQVIERRVGKDKSQVDLAASLGLDQNIVRQIEEDPSYLPVLFRKHVTRNLDKVGDIVDTMFDKAKGGDVKQTKLLMQMLGLLKETQINVNNDNRSVNLYKLKDDELEVCFKELAEGMDS